MEPERPGGSLPPGVTVEESAPRVEVDLATGMPLAPMLGSGDAAWRRGVSDGFAWALELERAPMALRGLLHPMKAPELPPPSEWKTWPDLRPEMILHGEASDHLRLWRQDLLSWRSDERGFPTRRCWRPLTPRLRFHHIAAHGGLLWLDTYDSGTLALDRGTGLIVAVLTSVHTAPKVAREAAGWIHTFREETASLLDHWGVSGDVLARAAQNGDSLSCLKLGLELLPTEPQRGIGLLQKGAVAGGSHAQITLALTYLEGAPGLAKDPRQAWIWLKTAAEQQSSRAEEGLKALF